MRRRRHPGPGHLARRLPGGDVLPWTRDEALVAIGAGAIDLLGYSLLSETDDHPVTVTGLLLIILSALPLLVRRRHPVSVIAAVLVVGSALRLTEPMSSHFGGVLTVALYSLARACTGPITVLGSAATVLVRLLSQSYGRLPSWQDLLADVVSVGLVIGTALVVNRWQREVAANRTLLADRAVAEERRRIARELHDIVAHHITTMQLMAGGARANLAGDPEVVRDALVTLETSGRLALREMRQLLDVLRAGDEPEDTPAAPQPGAGDLHRIVADSTLAGLPTELSIRGEERPLPPALGLTVFRIVQEALTNAAKHAGPARTCVRLTYLPDRITVEVRDDGGGAPPREGDRPGSRPGYGLVGMRERVALHGGTLRTGPQDGGGFAVAADLPLTPDEAAEAAADRGEPRR